MGTTQQKIDHRWTPPALLYLTIQCHHERCHQRRRSVRATLIRCKARRRHRRAKLPIAVRRSSHCWRLPQNVARSSVRKACSNSLFFAVFCHNRLALCAFFVAFSQKSLFCFWILLVFFACFFFENVAYLIVCGLSSHQLKTSRQHASKFPTTPAAVRRHRPRQPHLATQRRQRREMASLCRLRLAVPSVNVPKNAPVTTWKLVAHLVRGVAKRRHRNGGRLVRSSVFEFSKKQKKPKKNKKSSHPWNLLPLIFTMLWFDGKSTMQCVLLWCNFTCVCVLNCSIAFFCKYCS